MDALRRILVTALVGLALPACEGRAETLQPAVSCGASAGGDRWSVWFDPETRQCCAEVNGQSGCGSGPDATSCAASVPAPNGATYLVGFVSDHEACVATGVQPWCAQCGGTT